MKTSLRAHEHPVFVPGLTTVALVLSALSVAAAGARDADRDTGEADALDAAAPTANAARIVSLALPADEVLLAVAAAGRIVALNEFSDDVASNVREEARAVPRRVHATVEEVLSVEPDLVFCSAWASAELRAALGRAHVPIELVPPPTTLEEVAQNVRDIGRAVREASRAEELALDLERRVAAVESRAAGRTRPRVLLRSTDGVTPGAHTLAEAIVRAAGGLLVTAELGMTGFTALPAERTLSLDVDVVIVDAYRADGRARRLGSDPTLRALARRARVVELPPNLLMTTSHHVASTVERLERELHPDAR